MRESETKVYICSTDRLTFVISMVQPHDFEMTVFIVCGEVIPVEVATRTFFSVKKNFYSNFSAWKNSRE